jgi:ketosteroid isomerase-like protein
MKKALLLCVVLFISASHLHAQEFEDSKAKFKKLNEEFARLMVEDNFEEMLKFYADDIISMPSYQPMLRGINALIEADKMHDESGMKIISFSLETTDVMPAGEYFIEIGTYKISMEIPGMDAPWDDHGKYLTVWEDDDEGSMEIKIETWNTDTNPWMEMEKNNEGEVEGEGKPEMKKNEQN